MPHRSGRPSGKREVYDESRACKIGHGRSCPLSTVPFCSLRDPVCQEGESNFTIPVHPKGTRSSGALPFDRRFSRTSMELVSLDRNTVPWDRRSLNPGQDCHLRLHLFPWRTPNRSRRCGPLTLYLSRTSREAPEFQRPRRTPGGILDCVTPVGSFTHTPDGSSLDVDSGSSLLEPGWRGEGSVKKVEGSFLYFLCRSPSGTVVRVPPRTVKTLSCSTRCFTETVPFEV